MCLKTVVCVKLYEKISTLDDDFGQFFYVRIDFVLNTQIENIGQNQPPKSIFLWNFAYCCFNKYEFIW